MPYTPNKNYTGKTHLKAWWTIVRDNFDGVSTWVTNHASGKADKHKANDVAYKDGTKDTNVSDALDTVKADLATETQARQTADTNLQDNITNHRTATTLDHPNSSVTTAKLADNSVTTTKLADSSVNDDKLGTRTINQNISTTVDNTGTLTFLLSWIAKTLRAITGKTNWYTTPDISLADTKTHVDTTSGVHGSTPTAIADTLIQRDANGRAKVAHPNADNDISTKKYVDDSKSLSDNALEAEIRARQDADYELHSLIENEVSERQNADNELHTIIENETWERQGAIEQLQSGLDTETAERQYWDEQLQANIDETMWAMMRGDEHLHSRIDDEARTRQADVEHLQSQVTELAEQSKDDIIAEIAKKADNLQYCPVHGVMETVQKIIFDLFNELAADAITAEEFDALDLTAAQLDALNFTALDFDVRAKRALT